MWLGSLLGFENSFGAVYFESAPAIYDFDYTLGRLKEVVILNTAMSNMPPRFSGNRCS